MRINRFDKKHLETWKQSGLGQRRYCEENGIKYHTFLYWQRKQRSEAESTTEGFVRFNNPEKTENWFFHLSDHGFRLKFDIVWFFNHD